MSVLTSLDRWRVGGRVKTAQARIAEAEARADTAERQLGELLEAVEEAKPFMYATDRQLEQNRLAPYFLATRIREALGEVGQVNATTSGDGFPGETTPASPSVPQAEGEGGSNIGKSENTSSPPAVEGRSAGKDGGARAHESNPSPSTNLGAGTMADERHEAPETPPVVPQPYVQEWTCLDCGYVDSTRTREPLEFKCERDCPECEGWRLTFNREMKVIAEPPPQSAVCPVCEVQGGHSETCMAEHVPQSTVGCTCLFTEKPTKESQASCPIHSGCICVWLDESGQKDPIRPDPNCSVHGSGDTWVGHEERRVLEAENARLRTALETEKEKEQDRQRSLNRLCAEKQQLRTALETTEGERDRQRRFKVENQNKKTRYREAIEEHREQVQRDPLDADNTAEADQRLYRVLEGEE